MIKKINNLRITQAKLSTTKNFQIRITDGGFTETPGVFTLYITSLGYKIKLNGSVEVMLTNKLDSYVKLASMFPILEKELTESVVLQTAIENISKSLNKIFVVSFV